MNRRLRELHRTLVGLEFARDASTTSGIRYVGKLKVSGRSIRSAITFDDIELVRLPRLHLLAASQDVPELIAHVQEDGDYCYAHRDGHILDRFNIAQSIAISLQLMRGSLERSLTSHATAEIAAEFPQHWFGQTIYVDLKNPNAATGTIFRIVRPDRPEIELLADSPRIVRLFASGKKPEENPAALVHTTKTLSFAPGQARPETFSDLLEWLATVDKAASAQVLFAAQNTYPHKPYLFIIAPNGVVGGRLEFNPAIWKSFQRPQAFSRFVDRHREKVRLARFTGEPIDPHFIYTRNMDTQPNLSGKKITLVGCGTIGSHLAKMLAQSGAGYAPDGHLGLIDQQSLRAGNVGRHFLGVPDIGRPKSIAVRDHLIKQYPELDISATYADVLKNLQALDRNDLVIDATGDEGVANAINAHFVERRQRGNPTPASIFAWLFGNGAAAQVLCVTAPSDACYRCLRPVHGDPWRFTPLKSDYVLRETPAACGEGPFFPYGVAAPVTAAALALQLALDWSKGDPSPRLRTQRLGLDGTQQVKDQNPTRSAHCPICGTER